MATLVRTRRGFRRPRNCQGRGGAAGLPPTPDGTLSEARSSPAGSLAESHSAVVRAAWHEESSPVDTVGFRAPAWGAIRRPTPRCRDRGRSF